MYFPILDTNCFEFGDRIGERISMSDNWLNFHLPLFIWFMPEIGNHRYFNFSTLCSFALAYSYAIRRMLLSTLRTMIYYTCKFISTFYFRVGKSHTFVRGSTINKIVLFVYALHHKNIFFRDVGVLFCISICFCFSFEFVRIFPVACISLLAGCV